MWIVAIVLIIASILLTALTTKGPQKDKPPSVTDFEFPQSAEGTPQAVVFGDVWCTDYQVLWYGNFRTSAIKATGGKKG